MYNICLQQGFDSGLHQQHRLLMTQAMQQAICVMQLPILELSEWVKNEIESNPVLEIQSVETDPRDHYPSFKWKQGESRHLLLENLVASPISLQEHLMSQARLHFSDPDDMAVAQWILGHLDEKGFLNTPISELSTFTSVGKIEEILSTIQTFDPPGIGASTIRESLLIQLRSKEKSESIAYRMLSEHFEDLLHNRLLHISKRLKISIKQVSEAIQKDILPLNLNPGDRFQVHHAPLIVPDLCVFSINETWKIEINHAHLPTFHLSPTYREALQQQRLLPEEEAYLRRQLTSGKWVQHIVEKRKTTLLKIGEFLLKTQSAFFNDGTLVPLTLSDAAQDLGLHESTIARAVANKYLFCPHGMFALKTFFSHSLKAEDGGAAVSHHTLRHKLKDLISREDKSKPLSDTEIKDALSKTGISCARRTVTKYRKLLHIASASKRKRWTTS